MMPSVESTRRLVFPLLLLFVALLTGAPHVVAAQEVVWSPSLSIQYCAIQATAISPDGEHVAFVVREALTEGEQSEYLSHVWLADVDGGEARQFTRGEHSASNPAFSPDGDWLLFRTNRSGSNQIWAIPVAGGEAVQITEASEGVGAWSLSSDGQHIAFAMQDPESEAWTQAKEEKRDVIVADTNFRFSHLHLVSFDPHRSEIPQARRLTSGEFTVTGFDWAPDGRSIAFTHQPDPRINTARLAGDLSVVDVDATDDEAGGSVRHLVTAAGVESQPRFSPDGRWIAFNSTGAQPEPVGLGDVYVISSEGGDPRALAHTHDRSPGIVGWTGDGAHVLVTETVGTARHLQAVPVDGSDVRVVTSGNGVMGALSFTPGAESMAFTWQTADQPWDVYVSPVQVGERAVADLDLDALAVDEAPWSPQRVTDLHASVARPEMGRTELLTWRSEDGEFDIQGLLTYPVGYREGDRVPLVLNVHGGPAGAFVQSFTGGAGIYMVQTFAQEGYAVLRPNPRGSTGYGKEFRYANVRDWGFGDMDDLMAGVDQVIEMGVGDPERLLLMGWSYGGYMTSFAVTRTDRFKAASMGAGLPNLVSMVTTTDIQEYLAAHLDSEFWEDYEAYERHSAMYRIGNVTTPTQVIHGENDVRVPFTQGQEFYRGLQRRGVDTEMLILPRTPHGPQEPKLLMEVTPRILAWFEKYLPQARITTEAPPELD